MNEPGPNPAPLSHEDLTLYAMGSLPAEEMAAVTAALRQNPQARQELARIQDDLALLALSVDQQPAPSGSFQRLHARMSEAGRTTTSHQTAGNMTTTTSEVIASRGRSKWAVLTPWAIAACLAIACSILGYKVSSMNDALDGESRLVSNLAAKASHAQQVLEVLNAPDAQRVTLTASKTPPAATAHTVYLAERGALVMEASHMTPAPAGKAYELWVMPADGAAPLPAGTFWPNAEGYASLVLPKLPSGIAAKGFGITMEKASGSNTPTMPILLSGG
ncbi:MAG: anti-sigma factor domain-containing protein [Acidobacteriaceae bacterium]